VPAFSEARTVDSHRSWNANRNNFVDGGRPFATVSLGPLLFALPLEVNMRDDHTP
jgi:hypothetical protein